MFSSSIQTHGDNQDAPDYVYYNADIINNTTQNTAGGLAVVDPLIRFNETRDTALIRNAADYYFSIVRFTMNGANLDLPLFIPTITEGTGQTNVNLTTYSMATTFQQSFDFGSGEVEITGAPPQRYIQYSPETKNPTSAPTPRAMNADTFVGKWTNVDQYLTGQIVSMTVTNQYNSFDGPFYQALKDQNGNPPPIGVNPTTSQLWSLVNTDLGNYQDITSRYYWVYTYQHWVDLWNLTMYDPAQNGSAPNMPSTCAYQDTYIAFYNAYLAAGGTDVSFPYPTFANFINACYPPVMKYVAETSKFDIYLDSAGFGERLTAFDPVPVVPPPILSSTTAPTCRLFFNSNMFGLFSNYNNVYWNTPTITGLGLVYDGYVNEILATNKAYQNVADFRLQPYQNGLPPLGYSPTSKTGLPILPNMLSRVYWLAQQDYSSTDSLWSPVSSIVFTSTLLPIKTEATGAPVILGAGNLGFSQPTVQSAFQPIITDIALDTAQGGADAYRRFIYYTPVAEYRLSDFASSKQDIRNIDIQVYWKNRLDNQLYPISMFNLSSVSIKVMFKHKDAGQPKSY